MNFSELLLARESTRVYSGREVSREDMMKIVDAGRLAPSGCNAQPWKFVVVDEPEAKKKLLDAMVFGNNECAAPWADKAGAFVIVAEQRAEVKPMVLHCYNDSQRFAQADNGRASLNMCYAAAELGIGSCIIGCFDHAKMREAFGIPKDVTLRELIAFGYPEKVSEARKKIRKPREEVCSFNGWE